MPSQGVKRFAALDSWRGLAACMVAVYHFPAYSHVTPVALVRHAFLFVDFFFVLSGFVIAANYYDRLLDGISIRTFVWRRFGRLYPLHLAMLIVCIAYRALQLVTHPNAVFGTRPPFSEPYESAATIVANLTLTHALHAFDFVTWNAPSWSISVEFYTYIAFALLLAASRRFMTAALILGMLACCASLFALKGSIVAVTDFGLLRCLYGFGAGVLAWRIFNSFGGLHGTSFELITGSMMFCFLAFSGETPSSLAAPLVFALVLLAFAPQAGVVSRILLARPFLLLGTLSYSIYMTHFFLTARMQTAAGLLGRLTGHSYFTQDGRSSLLGRALWQGDLWCAVYLAVVVITSYLTYKTIEAPARAWFKAHSPRRSAGSVSRAMVETRDASG